MGKEGAVLLNVRFPDEHAKSGIKGSRNIPLNLLRMEARKLDRNTRYCLYCDNGQRSSVGAFLLIERGFDASYVQGGILEVKPPEDARDVYTDKGYKHIKPPLVVIIKDKSLEFYKKAKKKLFKPDKKRKKK